MDILVVWTVDYGEVIVVSVQRVQRFGVGSESERYCDVPRKGVRGALVAVTCFTVLTRSRRVHKGCLAGSACLDVSSSRSGKSFLLLRVQPPVRIVVVNITYVLDENDVRTKTKIEN